MNVDALLDEAFLAGADAEKASATTSRLLREHHSCSGGEACAVAGHHAAIAASARAAWDRYYRAVDRFLQALPLISDEAANEVVRSNVDKMMDSAMRMASIRDKHSSSAPGELPSKAVGEGDVPTKAAASPAPAPAAAVVSAAVGAPAVPRSSTVSSPPAAVMDAGEMSETTRKMVSQELLETERSYIANLRTFRDVFGTKLRPSDDAAAAVSAPVAMGQMTGAVSRGDSRAIFTHGMDIARGVLQFIAPSKPISAETALTAAEHELLFSFVDELLPFHEMFCRSLEISLTAWNANSGAGEVLLKYAPFLRVYKRVCAMHDARHNIVTSHSENTEGFTALLSQLVTSSRCAGQSVESYLIMPVQRLTRMRMLTETLLKHTVATHADHARLQAALVVIKEVVGDVNTDVARVEAQSRVSDVCYRFFPPRTELVQPHRLFVKEGALEQITPTGQRVPVVIILFNDVYVLATVHAVRVGVLADMLSYIDASPLFGAEHTSDDDERLAACATKSGFPFTILGTRFSYTFVADSETRRTEWIDAVTRAADEQRRKAMTRSMRIAPVMRHAASDGSLDAATHAHVDLHSSTSLPVMGLSRAPTLCGDPSEPHAAAPLTVQTTITPSRGAMHTSSRGSISGADGLDAFDDAGSEAVVDQPAPVHVLDTTSNHCMRCKIVFTLLNRRHHCRRCGYVVCGSCSTSQMKLPTSNGPVRVCDTCVATMHTAAQRTRPSITSTRSVSFAATPQHATPLSASSVGSCGSTSARTPSGFDVVHAQPQRAVVTSPLSEESPIHDDGEHSHGHVAGDGHVCDDSDPIAAPSTPPMQLGGTDQLRALVEAMPHAPTAPVVAVDDNAATLQDRAADDEHVQAATVQQLQQPEPT